MTLRLLRPITGSVLLAFVCAAQQDTGIITGQVTDATGSVIPSAAILLVNTATNG